MLLYGMIKLTRRTHHKVTPLPLHRACGRRRVLRIATTFYLAKRKAHYWNLMGEARGNEEAGRQGLWLRSSGIIVQITGIKCFWRLIFSWPLVVIKVVREIKHDVFPRNKTDFNTFLKTLDTIGNCQKPVFSLGVSQHMHEISNLWKF